MTANADTLADVARFIEALPPYLEAVSGGLVFVLLVLAAESHRRG